MGTGGKPGASKFDESIAASPVMSHVWLTSPFLFPLRPVTSV